ncbi:VanZ family protein [Fusobacterium sp.]|uniref:VanZ family protein n=1 Tax=Fusobacterium sp. TaxID=68766 RepID=UPI00344CFEEE
MNKYSIFLNLTSYCFVTICIFFKVNSCKISRKICSLTIIICMSFSISNEVHSHFI